MPVKYRLLGYGKLLRRDESGFDKLLRRDKYISGCIRFEE